MSLGDRKRRRRGLSFLPRFAAISLSLWAVAVILTGDYLMIARLGLYAAPMLMCFAAALSALALLQRSRKTALVMLCVALGLFGAQAPPLLRAMVPDRSAAGEGLISVVSLSNRTKNLDSDSTARLIRSVDADIFILQEVAVPIDLIESVTGIPGSDLYHCHCLLYTSPSPRDA